MQNIQLKTEEYQISNSSENLFKLTPLIPDSKLRLNLEYNFASIYCLKTEKTIRTLPSLSDQKSSTTLFRSQIDIQINSKISTFTSNSIHGQGPKSVKNIQQPQRTMLIPKPSSSYCQICKETYADYLQHINHSSHKKKIKQNFVLQNNIQDLTDILRRKIANQHKNSATASKFQRKKNNDFTFSKDLSVQNRKIKKVTYENQKGKTDDSDKIDYQRKIGSKKRIIQDISGQKGSVTIESNKNIAQFSIDNQKSNFITPPTSLKCILIDEISQHQEISNFRRIQKF